MVAIKWIVGFFVFLWVMTSFQKWEYKARGIEERPPPPVYREGLSAQELMSKRATPQEILKACNAKEDKGQKDETCDEISNGTITTDRLR